MIDHIDENFDADSQGPSPKKKSEEINGNVKN
jgi:hypothetical protein